MPVTQEDIQKAIEETERELAELKAAHRVLERLEGFATKSNTKAATPTIGASGVINLDEVELPGKPAKRGPTLLDDIRGLIGRLGSQEFTVNHGRSGSEEDGQGIQQEAFQESDCGRNPKTNR